MENQQFLADKIRTQEYQINMGPQHPAMHGVMRFVLTLDGEEIRNIEPVLGYIHRSIEKMSEHVTYKQIIHLTDRLDYLSSHMNNEAVALLVEKATGIEVNDRIKVIRTIMSELTRIASHQLWWGVMGMDTGALTTFFYAFRDRELINDIFEETCGSRLTMNYNVIGGVRFDLHENFVKRVKDFIAHFKTKLPEYDNLLSNNVIFRKRTEGIGILSKEDVIAYGMNGPTARASGFACDIRKKLPYSAYDRVEFEEIMATEGDAFARYKVRILEMWESMRIIEQLIDNIPEGEFKVKTKAVIKLPEGEWMQRVETARGDFGVYAISDGKKTPLRFKFRSPSFANMHGLNEMSKGGKIADLVVNFSTIDVVVPDIDR
jgi:NADH-quinone oxidoreductase subunit D/NADH-quinone oxidoreductase subunit C/D